MERKSEKVTFEQNLEFKEGPNLGDTQGKNCPSWEHTSAGEIPLSPSVMVKHRLGFLLWNHVCHLGEKRNKCEDLALTCTSMCIDCQY